MTWTKEQRDKYNVPYAERPPEQKIRANEALKEKMAARAIAEGREPRRVGRPPKLTLEEKEASRINQNKKRSLRALAANKIKRAAKAVAEGRTPGLVGARSKLSADERRKAKTQKSLRWRAANLEESRKREREYARIKRDAVKAGTWNPPPLKRLTADEKRVVNVVMGARRRARLRAAGGGDLKPSDLRTMRWRQNGLCPCCNIPLGTHDIHVDHWIPLIKGGSGDVSNLRLLHGKCNLKKGAKHPDELRQPYEVAA